MVEITMNLGGVTKDSLLRLQHRSRHLVKVRSSGLAQEKGDTILVGNLTPKKARGQR